MFSQEDCELVRVPAIEQQFVSVVVYTLQPATFSSHSITSWCMQSMSHVLAARSHSCLYVLLHAAGVRTLFWYAYDNDSMEGLTQSTESDKRPEELNEAGVAYNNVKAWLTGARMMSLSRNKQGIWMASLLRGASSKSWIVWNGDQRVSSRVLTVPTGVKSRQDIITGARTSMKGVRQLPVTDVPLLLLA